MTQNSNEIHKRDFGLRKEKVLLKLKLVETKHCFELLSYFFFIFKIIKIR